MAQSTNSAVLAAGLQSQYSQSLGDNDTLGLVIWWWDTLENLKSLHSSGTPGGLVRDHAADSLVEDSRWGTEMEWACDESDTTTTAHIRQDMFTSSSWVVSRHLPQIRMVLYCSEYQSLPVLIVA